MEQSARADSTIGMLKRMTEDFYLTPTDVAEALGCELSESLALIESGQIVAHYQRGWKIAHHQLSIFISARRREALELGHVGTVDVPFVMSRPVNDDVKRV